MFTRCCFAALAVVCFFLSPGLPSAFAAAPGCPADVMRSFSELVEKEAEAAGYLEEKQVIRLRAQAEEIFPLHPKVSIGEAARLDREGEKTFLNEEIRKKFPRHDAEYRRAVEKEAEALFPLYGKGAHVEVSYRFGKYHAKGVYYGRKGEYLQIGAASVPVRDLSEEELRKFDPEKNREARSSYIKAKCDEFAEKKQAALRALKEQWDAGQEDRRFKLGYLYFFGKWQSGEQLLDELIRMKNSSLLQALRVKSEDLARSGDLAGAEQVFQRFLTDHPALSSELEPDRQRLKRSTVEERSRIALETAGKMSDPGEARAFLEKFLADNPGSPSAAKILSVVTELEIREGELKRCRETIESARKLEPENACLFLEHFISEYSDYFGIGEVKALYQTEKKETERKRCAQILEEARQITSDEQAVQLLERFIEDQPDCDGIEAVREACRERQARLEKNGDGI